VNCIKLGKIRHATVVACTVFLFLTGCSPFKPTPRQEPVAPLPAAYSLYSEQETDTGKWWESFGNAELNRMVEEALAANFDIRVAWANLRQAGAEATQANADKYPTLEMTGDYSHTRKYVSSTKRESTGESHSIGLGAGYEIDLWGRIRANAMSGELDYMASREDLKTSAMTVASEVVTKWVKIQVQRQKKHIIAEQVKANETYLELIELRFRNSISTALDVYQQRENLAGVMAQLPQVESEEQLLLNELAFLLGKPVGSVTVTDAELPELAELPHLGLPADLLANRPDVQSAGLALSSADWAVSAARANRLPSLNLTGTGTYSGGQITTIFDNWALKLAAAVVGPIFDGGYRKAAVEKARGEVDEKLATYESTVYTAFKEVEDALTQEKWQKKYVEAKQRQLDASRVSLHEALSRYSQGLDTYLPVLSALLSAQELEVSMAEYQMNLLLYRVELHRVLGGTWMNDLERPKARSATAKSENVSNEGQS